MRVRLPAWFSALALRAPLVVVTTEEGTCRTLVAVAVAVAFAVATVEVGVVAVVAATTAMLDVVVEVGVAGCVVDVRGGAGVVVVVAACNGREFSVKTRTSKSRGLDHISRCEVRRANRRRVMVIEG